MLESIIVRSLGRFVDERDFNVELFREDWKDLLLGLRRFFYYFLKNNFVNIIV
jgi:hypothetical protein